MTKINENIPMNMIRGGLRLMKSLFQQLPFLCGIFSFFEKNNFEIVAEQKINIRGVELLNYKMKRAVKAFGLQNTKAPKLTKR